MEDGGKNVLRCWFQVACPIFRSLDVGGDSLSTATDARELVDYFGSQFV